MRTASVTGFSLLTCSLMMSFFVVGDASASAVAGVAIYRFDSSGTVLCACEGKGVESTIVGAGCEGDMADDGEGGGWRSRWGRDAGVPARLPGARLFGRDDIFSSFAFLGRNFDVVFKRNRKSGFRRK